MVEVVRTTQELAEHWNSMADWYIQFAADKTVKVYNSMIPFLNLREGNVIIEAGCGPGQGIDIYLPLLSPRAQILVNDLSSKFIEYVQAKKLPRIAACVADNEALPYSDGAGDRYIGNLSLMLVESPERMAREAFRVLRPGGIAGFSVWGDRTESPMADLMVSLIDKYSEVKLRNGFHLSDMEKLTKLLRDAGFRRILTFKEYINIPIVDSNFIGRMMFQNPEISGVFDHLSDERKSQFIVDLRTYVDDLLEVQGRLLCMQILIAVAFKV